MSLGAVVSTISTSNANRMIIMPSMIHNATSPPPFARDGIECGDDAVGASRALLYHMINEMERDASEDKDEFEETKKSIVQSTLIHLHEKINAQLFGIHGCYSLLFGAISKLTKTRRLQDLYMIGEFKEWRKWGQFILD